MTANAESQNARADRALEELGRVALREHSMESLLERVAELTATVMPGDPAASVSVLLRDRPRTVAYSKKLAIDLDETQYERDYGPCLHAARNGIIVEIADTRIDNRWPDYGRRAGEVGVFSLLSVPLSLGPPVTAALNTYARTPQAFDDESRSLALRLGSYAAVAIENMYVYEDARAMAENLQAALESRAIIDQAKGILMERYKMTADTAFQAMARVSMQTNRRVRDIAEQLVTTGELLGVPRNGA
jgi:GAF domain-containing protein